MNPLMTLVSRKTVDLVTLKVVVLILVLIMMCVLPRVTQAQNNSTILLAPVKYPEPADETEQLTHVLVNC